MKINPLTGQPVISAYKAQRIICKVSELTPAADQLSLSREALALSSTISKLKAQMDIRSPEEAARLAEISRQIKDGSYQVDSRKTAAKIVDEYLHLNK